SARASRPLDSRRARLASPLGRPCSNEKPRTPWGFSFHAARRSIVEQTPRRTWDNAAMRRHILPITLALLLAASIAATGQGPKKGPLTLQVTLVQEATVRHPHPPAGDAGDTFSTVLKLNAIGTVLGFPNGTPMGTMAFTWGPLNGSCSSNAAECSGTTTI